MIYTRVSEDQRDTGRSVGEQETECRRIAERNGWTVARVFVDNDRSASRYATKDRPGFTGLMTFLATQPVDVLLTWESSRLTRDLATFVPLRDLCRDRGIRWSYGARLLDLSDDGDQFMAVLDAAANERASAETSKRVRRAVRANASAGRPHGRVAYGYQRHYDPNTRNLIAQVEHPEQAAVLREVAQRFLSGESFFALARELDARGVPPPAGGKTWHPTNLARLMKNPAYHGERVLQGAIVGPANWPAIFDDETWWSLQARLSDPSRRTSRDGAVKHLLTGIAVCGACSAPMRLGNNRGRLAYFCSRSFHVSRVQAETDNLIDHVVVARLSRPDALEAFVDQHDGDELAEVLAQTRATRARLDTFYDAAAKGEISAAGLARIETTLAATVRNLETRSRQLSSTTALEPVLGLDLGGWRVLPIATRRETIRLLMSVTVLPVGKGRRSFDPRSIEIEWSSSSKLRSGERYPALAIPTA